MISQRVLEVVAFTTLMQEVSTDTPAYVLRPARSLFEIMRDNDSSKRRVEGYRATVQEVATRRSELLHATGDTPPATLDAPDGKVLATDLTSTMYDGVAGELTGGYFDHADAPPPETWLAVVGQAKESPGYNNRVFLLSWIDQAEVERVNVGIESTPSGCLSWIENWRELDDFGESES